MAGLNLAKVVIRVRFLWYNRTMPYKDITKQKQAQHESYIRNRDKVRLANKSTKEKRYELIRQLKEQTPCMDCGIQYPYFVMEYDHRDPLTKVGDVNRLLRIASMEAVYQEIEKCDLVCANCHKFRSHERRPTVR